jgi:hypothetical protein
MTLRLLLASLACGLLAGGCSGPAKDVLVAPQPLLAPYDTRAGELTWAVAPPSNDAATSTVEPMQFGDALVASLEETRGIRCLPMNRTTQAMRDLGIRSITSASQAHRLATAMGVDAVVVTSITAYDPYTPEVGVAAAVFARPGPMLPQTPVARDPRRLSRQVVDAGAAAAGNSPDAPVCVVSEHLNGRNHQVLLDLKDFAQGRLQKDSALGWRRYLTAMPLYMEFAAHRTVQLMMQREWARIGSLTPPEPAATPAPRSTVAATPRMAKEDPNNAPATHGPQSQVKTARERGNGAIIRSIADE